MLPFEISFGIDRSRAHDDFDFTLWVDGEQLWRLDHERCAPIVTVSVPDSQEPRLRELAFCLEGKQCHHTEISSSGEIVRDHVIAISDFTVEGVLAQHILVSQSRYTHDFNGTGSETQDSFFGVMGCNGRVSLEFSTPIFLWLLQNS